MKQSPALAHLLALAPAPATEALFHFVRTSVAPAPSSYSSPCELVKGFSCILHPLACWLKEGAPSAVAAVILRHWVIHLPFHPLCSPQMFYLYVDKVGGKVLLKYA